MEMDMVLMLEMVLMMISIARDDGDDDGDDLPFREVISPAESSRRRWLFSFVGFRLVAAEKLGNSAISRVFTPGGSYRREGAPRGPPGIQEGAWRALGGAPGTLLAAWWVPSPPSSVDSRQFPK